ETVVLSIDAERERISLGIKQLTDDPFAQYVAANDKGAIVKGVIKAVDAKAATVELAENVEGTLRASEISRDRVNDATEVLNVGDEVEAKITNVDRKNRVLSLSIKAKDQADEREAMDNLSEQQDANAPKTIGDLIKKQMENSNES
ncbi:MAG: S1 RNA-binding domain-containing protein, partial [Pseudomonadota bacterium]|nr:S1 RNA-binding domain-containing protein [Pseudomonadota bacterium]